jgi:hypothetical protein
MIALSERSLQQTEIAIGRALQCVAEQPAIVSAVAAEHIRAMLYGACVLARDSSAASTIHTTRLLTNARRAVDLTWPSDATRDRSSEPQMAETDVCTATLEMMRILGDAADVGRGQWIATPLRIIALDGANDCVVVGSAPIAALKHNLGLPIACAGVSRFTSTKSLTKAEHRAIVQSMDDWLGPSTPLSAWTAQVLASHDARMEPSHGLSVDQLELYAPDIVSSQQRTGRWIPAGHVGRPIDGVRLCRPRGAFARSYSRPHFLARFDFEDGALSLRSSVSIAHEVTLRLRFGLDLLLNSPRRISITASALTFAIERPSPLPDPENRIYALGWSDLTAAESSERLTFSNSAMPFVLHALQRLSIAPHIAQRHIP